MLASSLHSTVAFALSIGLNVEDIKRTIGLDALMIHDPKARVPDSTIADLWKLMEARKPNEPLTIRMAQRAPFSTLGGFAYSMQFAGSLREALEVLADNDTHLGGRLESSLIESSDSVALEWYHPLEEKGGSRAGEPALGLLYRVINEALELNNCVTEVRLRCKEPMGPLHDYEAFFRATVIFGSARNTIVFDKNRLQDKPSRRNLELFALVENSAAVSDYTADSVNYSSSAERLKKAIESNASDGDFSVASAALKSHMSVRSAQRVASQHGTTVTDMIERVRLRIAKDLLQDSQHSVESISLVLAYSEARAFRRAFKRMTGLTPKQYRVER